jgi:phage terminase Nu1 subunit (DNA packaging protein)
MITKESLKSLKQAEVLALLGISERRIQQLHGEGLPRNGEGRGVTYVWDQVLAWRDARLSGSQEAASGRISHGERLKKIKADDAELDLELKLKTLMVAAKVRVAWASSKAATRARLLSLPSTVALKIDPSHTQAQREEIIREDVYEALGLLAGGDL